MNNTHLNIQQQDLILKRFPSNQFDKSLRAWDAADEYMIDSISDTLDLSSLKHIVIINDSFGALSCAMSKLASNAHISVFGDSYMSEQGIKQNLKASNLDKNQVKLFSALLLPELANKPVDLILLKVPRTLAYLDFILAQLVTVIPDFGKLHFVSGAMVKLITSSSLKVFNKYFSDTRTSLARKKSRLIYANTTIDNNPNLKQFALTKTVSDPDLCFTLHNFPNVFCREQIDIGARYMLKFLPRLEKSEQTIVDLGSGNGILGISLLIEASKLNVDAKVVFVDESHMALASAKLSLQKALEDGLVDESIAANAEFQLDHCLQSFLQEPSNHGLADIVICNPPFHQQNTVIDDIAWQMFVDAKKVLKHRGELRIVGNRHLDHRVKLSKLFGGCKVIASDKKFVILSSIKNND